MIDILKILTIILFINGFLTFLFTYTLVTTLKTSHKELWNKIHRPLPLVGKQHSIHFFQWLSNKEYESIGDLRLSNFARLVYWQWIFNLCGILVAFSLVAFILLNK